MVYHMGRITKIEVQKRRPGRRSIFHDGEFLCGLDALVVERLGLREGIELTPGEIDRLIAEEELHQAKEKALRLLYYRLRSRKEMEARLRNRGFSSKVIERVIEDLSKVGLIDDMEFARALVRERLSNRGKKAIEMELARKGVPDDLIKVVISELLDSDDEERVAQEVARKRISQYRHLPLKVARRRLRNYLLRRGFDHEVVRRTIEAAIEYINEMG
jgi:regulatory protein